jgi:hypothetical protein
VRLWLAVSQGDAALAPGVYELAELADPLVARLVAPLTRREASCVREQVEHCILQRGLAAGPAAIFFTGDLARALTQRGPRGYRELLLMIGSQAARVLTTASALGIAACPSGGLLEDGFRALTHTDGYRDCLLFALGLGMPA